LTLTRLENMAKDTGIFSFIGRERRRTSDFDMLN
jgi:hypothetical protein